jgi:glycolate oxidase FAD binding subunit
MRELHPATFEEGARALAAAAAEGLTVRTRGAGTKLEWGLPAACHDVELHTTELDGVVEHNAGDLTAVLQAGVPLASAQRTFARAGQMLALDPPLGEGATIGGIVATADSGPLRHRYGAPRDLILGMTVALSDGTIARSGGKVIKNVAGYDIGKLFAGSFGTLGTILSVSVRLHPLPRRHATSVGSSGNPDVLAAAAGAIAAAPLELEALDVAWRGGRGGILARSGGVEASPRAERAAATMRQAGLEQVELVEEDGSLWSRQRSGQRALSGALVRIAARPSELAGVLRAASAAGGTLVGRAALGASFVALEPSPEAVEGLRAALPAGTVAVLLDAPPSLRASIDPWGADSTRGGALELMRRIKARFDPAGTCNRGIFVGGI